MRTYHWISLFKSYIETASYLIESKVILIANKRDEKIPFITEEIKRYSTLYYNRLMGHENSYVTELGNPLNARRRLKQQWPSDLKDQREEE
jgi:hypothetical protein